ncbi:ATP-grasp domain-containing protein [Streptomyces pinistramenti]|uniref:ATP-grasp domain-containing protein n=1 Tax=Streptomyces pinistramenti TaxID=2884812 RepID=UPI001D06E4BC|nr:ATP-grasp domain-containing protein [Streptomyces pinistramenti]MCB5910430.1 ATP-grasp domain-containing protein [Streptomyces pinistramenti]
MGSAAKQSAFIIFSDLSKIGPYLTELRARGLAVLAVSQKQGSAMVQRGIGLLGKPDHPFAGITDVSLRDAEDLSGIADQASRWAQDYDIAGVLVGAEVYVEAGQTVSDLLGLPAPGWRASRVCRNKLLQRRYLDEWSPKSVLITGPAADAGRPRAAQLAEHYDGPFPAAVKPLDRESSIGVRVVEDTPALIDAIAELDPGSRLLVEERVQGREYNVDSLVVDGKPLVTMLTQKGTNEDSTAYFVELIHTTPPDNLDDRETGLIVDAQHGVIQRLAFENGFAHAEYRIDDDGRVALMEIAARAPGDACLHLYHLSTGQAVEPVLIDIAMGRPTDYQAVFRRRGRQVYFAHTPGILRDVTADGLEGTTPRWLADTTGIWPALAPVDEHAPATVHELFVLKPRGDELFPLTESSNRAVTAIFDAPLDADIDAEEARIRQAVTIDTDPTG